MPADVIVWLSATRTGKSQFSFITSKHQGKLDLMKLFCNRASVSGLMFSFVCSQRVLQNSFSDGVANPSDAASIKNYVVKNDGALSGYPGSTYLLSQKFEFNWTVIGNMDKVKEYVYTRTERQLD